MEQTRIIPQGNGMPDMRTRAMSDPGKTAMVGSFRAIDMECMAGNRYGLATGHTREHVLLQFKSAPNVTGRRLPLNLALVIDRSGSMEGEPLDYVKRACGYVVDLLEPDDILSIVTFEEQVDVLVPSRRVVNKALLKEHINRIEVGNTTNLYDGMVVGCQQVAALRADGYVNRVLLLTDGDPTAGIKDFGSIVGQAAEQRSRGITITALGFGPEYNEELIAGIAKRSGGNYYYISRPDLIPEVFRRELETLMTIIGRNMILKLGVPRGVQVREIFGRHPSMLDARHMEVHLADIERGSAMSVLCELELSPHTPGIYRVLKAGLRYDDASTGRTEVLSSDLELEFVADTALIASGVNPIVKQELEVALASRSLEKTVMGMKTQQISAMAATMQLQKTMTLLASQGRLEEAQGVQNAIDSIKQGGQDVEKTLSTTIFNLDQGKKK